MLPGTQLLLYIPGSIVVHQLLLLPLCHHGVKMGEKIGEM